MAIGIRAFIKSAAMHPGLTAPLSFLHIYRTRCNSKRPGKSVVNKPKPGPHSCDTISLRSIGQIPRIRFTREKQPLVFRGIVYPTRYNFGYIDFARADAGLTLVLHLQALVYPWRRIVALIDSKKIQQWRHLILDALGGIPRALHRNLEQNQPGRHKRGYKNRWRQFKEQIRLERIPDIQAIAVINRTPGSLHHTNRFAASYIQ